MGFPIRKSPDRSSFAAPRSLSQRTTSFIACACQGIHRTPLRHLIALIINARAARRGGRDQKSEVRDQKSELQPRSDHLDGIAKDPAPRQEDPGPALSPRRGKKASAASSSRRHDRPAPGRKCPGTGLRKTSVTREFSGGRGGQASAGFHPSPGATPQGTSGQLFSSRCQCGKLRLPQKSENRSQRSEKLIPPSEFWLLISGF
jgi:hypothetical protein